MQPTASGRGSPRIGLWGTFDVESLGDALYARIARAELARRLPEAEIRTFAPLGSERPTAWDGEDPAEPLGPYRPERLSELAEELDVVVVGPGDLGHGHDELLAPLYGVPSEQLIERGATRFFVDGLGRQLERTRPVVWHAVAVPFDLEPEEAERYRRALSARPYVSVRDEASRRRLERAGVDRDIEVVPDPMVLLPRLLPESDLERRLEQLRFLGWFPEDGRALVVQGGEALAASVEAVADAVARLADERGAEVLVLETAPGDAPFAEGVAARLGDRARRASGATVEDVVAAIAASEGFVGDSAHAKLVAFAYGRPYATPESGSSLDDLRASFEKVASGGARLELVGALQRRLDASYDRIAEVVTDAVGADARPEAGREARELRSQLDAIWASHAALGRRIAAERVALAKDVEERAARHREEVTRLEGEIERHEAEIVALRRTLADETQRLEGEVAGRERQIRELLNTRTYRYTAFLRGIWGRLRRIGR